MKKTNGDVLPVYTMVNTMLSTWSNVTSQVTRKYFHTSPVLLLIQQL